MTSRFGEYGRFGEYVGRLISIALAAAACMAGLPAIGWGDDAAQARDAAEKRDASQSKKKEPLQESGSSTLDDALLEGLENELLDDLAPPVAKPKSSGAESSRKEPDSGTAKPPTGKEKPVPKELEDDRQSELDRQLLEELGGEDLGAAADDENPLLRIGNKMRAVERSIAEGDASKQTQHAQEDIVAQLAELIERIRKQKKSLAPSPRGSSSGSGRPEVRQPRQASQGKTAKRPVRDSTQRLGREEARQVDMAAMQSIMKETWGQLPAKQREEMIQLSVDQFLPKYAEQIEQYFRKLAEDVQE